MSVFETKFSHCLQQDAVCFSFISTLNSKKTVQKKTYQFHMKTWDRFLNLKKKQWIKIIKFLCAFILHFKFTLVFYSSDNKRICLHWLHQFWLDAFMIRTFLSGGVVSLSSALQFGFEASNISSHHWGIRQQKVYQYYQLLSEYSINWDVHSEQIAFQTFVQSWFL